MIDKHFRAYTDLALEASEMVREKDDIEINGVKVDIDETKDKDIKVTLVEIETDEGSKIMQKPKGKYISIEAECLKDSDIEKHSKVSKILACNIEKLICDSNDKKDIKNVLVVGLGNSSVTADSLGPNVAQNIIVTRHLFSPSKIIKDKEIFGISSAIVPGVMGMTGMESSEIVKGVVDKINPNIVIVIDSLAARNMNRINTTIQLTDTGIYPGSGVGNTRKILNKDTLGKKVIAIGVPTVVNALTLVSDICNLELKEQNNALSDEEINEFMKYEKLCVTPKEEDIIIKRISNVIIDGINMFIHEGLTQEDIKNFLY